MKTSNRFRSAFTRAKECIADSKGTIDLASIMVGVLVIGVVGGVVSAMVFAVVPWSQDQAAKQSLDSVRTAQSVAMVKDSAYMTDAQLVTEKYLEPSTAVATAPGVDDNCFISVSKSATGACSTEPTSAPTSAP